MWRRQNIKKVIRMITSPSPFPSPAGGEGDIFSPVPVEDSMSKGGEYRENV